MTAGSFVSDYEVFPVSLLRSIIASLVTSVQLSLFYFVPTIVRATVLAWQHARPVRRQPPSPPLLRYA